MKTLMFSTIFIFTMVFGQNSIQKQEISLIKSGMPCVTDGECKIRLGPKSKCEDHVCLCYGDGKLKECPISVAEVIQIQGPRSSNYDVEPFIGKDCKSGDDCPYMYAVCNETKKCSCGDGYIGTLDNKYCLRVARKLEDPCYDNVQCKYYFPNSTCIKQKCQCPDNYHAAATQCWKNVGKQIWT